MPALVLLKSEAENIYSGSQKPESKNTEFLGPISSIKITHLAFWFIL